MRQVMLVIIKKLPMAMIYGTTEDDSKSEFTISFAFMLSLVDY
jgi:hypothetical protein